MARIRIEEKEQKSGSILPWILGLLVVALAIWGISELFEESTEEVYTETTVVDEEAPQRSSDVVAIEEDSYQYGPVSQNFLDHTANMQGDMGLDHEFSHRAITLLAQSAVAIALDKGVEDDDIAENGERAVYLADQITKDPYAENHADMIKEAALKISSIFDEVDEEAYDERYEDLVDEMRKQARDIDTDVLTLNQKEDVRGFFKAARRVVQAMK